MYFIVIPIKYINSYIVAGYIYGVSIYIYGVSLYMYILNHLSIVISIYLYIYIYILLVSDCDSYPPWQPGLPQDDF